jgi:hypothetical protein
MRGGSTKRGNAAREHPTRAAILELLATDGRIMSASEIRAGLPHEPGAAAFAHHLRILERTALVIAADDYYELI